MYTSVVAMDTTKVHKYIHNIYELNMYMFTCMHHTNTQIHI